MVFISFFFPGKFVAWYKGVIAVKAALSLLLRSFSIFDAKFGFYELIKNTQKSTIVWHNDIGCVSDTFCHALVNGHLLILRVFEH